jgi:hypothetical protein
MIDGMITVIERRERRGKQLLDDPKETRRYRKVKEATLAGTLYTIGFGSDCGPVVS